MQLYEAIREAVIGRDSYLFECAGALLSQSRNQSFHIGMVLIVGFEEQQRDLIVLGRDYRAEHPAAAKTLAEVLP